MRILNRHAADQYGRMKGVESRLNCSVLRNSAALNKHIRLHDCWESLENAHKSKRKVTFH